MEKEILEAAKNGIREYMRSTRGANLMGANADIGPVQGIADNTWQVEIVHKNGVMFLSLLVI